MSLRQRKRHVNRNNRARKLVRDFFMFKEDCLNNDDLQVLNRTIAELIDLINDAQNDDEVNFYSDWSYSWDEDDVDDNFWESDFFQEQADTEPSQDTPALPQLPMPKDDLPLPRDGKGIYILSRGEIDALLDKMPKYRDNSNTIYTRTI